MVRGVFVMEWVWLVLAGATFVTAIVKVWPKTADSALLKGLRDLKHRTKAQETYKRNLAAGKPCYATAWRWRSRSPRRTYVGRSGIWIAPEVCVNLANTLNVLAKVTGTTTTDFRAVDLLRVTAVVSGHTSNTVGAGEAQTQVAMIGADYTLVAHLRGWALHNLNAPAATLTIYYETAEVTVSAWYVDGTLCDVQLRETPTGTGHYNASIKFMLKHTPVI